MLLVHLLPLFHTMKVKLIVNVHELLQKFGSQN